jgi:hypothetical protein
MCLTPNNLILAFEPSDHSSWNLFQYLMSDLPLLMSTDVKNVDHSIAEELLKLASLDFQQRHNEKSHPNNHIPATNPSISYPY